MSKYTTTLYEILKNIVPNPDTLTTDELVQSGVPLFFDFDFPWYAEDGSGKSNFERMYLMSYLNNEIGQETLGAHKQCFRRKMFENMERMKQKYQLLGDMTNVAGERRAMHEENINDTESTSNSGEQTVKSTSNRNQNQNSQSIHSDNPQVTFANNDYASEMDRGEITATDSTNDSSESSVNNDGTRTGNTLRKLSEIETDTRNSDKYFDAINRGVYLINTELLEECRPLFMKIW